MLRSVAFFVLLATALIEAQAWIAMQSNFRLRAPSSATSRAITRWDDHLDLARDAYRKRRWGEVRQICSRVIKVALESHTAAAAHDWAAVEQAHLRLALAEQQDKKVDAARRTFQRGTAACPSSDTLFMAWALMESKIHNPRSRKVARALLRRAISLNPKRHSQVLGWRVFLELKEASEAAVDMVCTTLSNNQETKSSSSAPAAASVTGAATPHKATASSTAGASTTGDAASKRSKQRELGRGSTSSSSSPDFVARWAMRTAAYKERHLSTELLDLCSTVNKERRAGTWKAKGRTESQKKAARLEEFISWLEGRGHVGDSAQGRVLSGSWRLAYTTCPVCERLLVREGLDFYQRFDQPMQALFPKAGEPASPFRCEVFVTSSPGASVNNDGKIPVSHFLWGWAQTHASRETGRVTLRQQVAPRRSARLTAGYRPGLFGEPLPPALPPAALRALGQIVRGGTGFEKLVTQDVTYVGGRLRMGRNKDGDVFVYERCMWPRNQCP